MTQYYDSEVYDVGDVASDIVNRALEISGPYYGGDVGAVAPPRASDIRRPSGGIVSIPTRTGGRPMPVRAPGRSAPGFDLGINTGQLDALEALNVRLDQMEAERQARAQREALERSVQEALRGRLGHLVQGRIGVGAAGPLRDTMVSPIQANILQALAQFRTTLSFAAATIAAGASVQIQVQPQRWFVGTQLIVPPSQASAIRVQDIKVAQASQLIAQGDINGENCTPNLYRGNYSTIPCAPSAQFILYVRNASAVALTDVSISYQGYAFVNEPSAAELAAIFTAEMGR